MNKIDNTITGFGPYLSALRQASGLSCSRVAAGSGLSAGRTRKIQHEQTQCSYEEAARFIWAIGLDPETALTEQARERWQWERDLETSREIAALDERQARRREAEARRVAAWEDRRQKMIADRDRDRAAHERHQAAVRERFRDDPFA